MSEEEAIRVSLARLEGKLDAHAARSEERFDHLEEKVTHHRNNADQKFVALDHRMTKTDEAIAALKIEAVRNTTIIGIVGGAFTLIVAFITSWFGGGGVHH